MTDRLNIYNANGTSFYNAVLESYTFSDTALGFDTTITGSFVSPHRLINKFTGSEYVEYQVEPTGDKTKFYLVKDVTQTRDSKIGSKDGGLYRYACIFNTPSIELLTMPAYSVLQKMRTFGFMGSASDLVNIIRTSLTNNWKVNIQEDYILPTNIPDDILSFTDCTISKVLEQLYERDGVPFNIQGRTINIGRPVIKVPHVFKWGDGLKNDNVTPKNNTVITKVFPKGTDRNLPYPYPRIVHNDEVVTTYKIVNNEDQIVDVPLHVNTLMPSIYRSSLIAHIENGFNPRTHPVIDYYIANDTYVTPYNPELPSPYDYNVEDIYPSIEGMTSGGLPIDVFKAVIFDADDNSVINTETGEIEKSFFNITLNPMGFDLWASAAARKAMTFSMRSGDTIGANYNAAVLDDDWVASFYDKQDDDSYVFNPNKASRDMDMFPDSTETSITIRVYKDIDTFGYLLPDQASGWTPKAGDKMVILGIELPLSYVLSAENELSADGIQYLKDNNFRQRTYPLLFDEGFLHENPQIASQITTNSLIQFSYEKDENGDDIILSQPVQSIVKKHLTTAIPTWNITITDELTIVINAVAENTSKLEEQQQIIRDNDIKGANTARHTNFAVQKAFSAVFDSAGNNRIDKVEVLSISANAALFGQNPNNFAIESPLMAWDNVTNQVLLGATRIVHLWKELEGTIKEWNIDTQATFTLDPDLLYYVYVKANRTNDTALWDISSKQIKYKDVDDVFYFVAGQLINIDGMWNYVSTNGMTSILGGTISTHVTKSPNFNISDTEFTGMMIDFLNANILMGDGASIITRKITIRPPTGEDLDVYGKFNDIDEELDFPYAVSVDTGGRTNISEGETITATCSLVKGFTDYTSIVSKWTITRASGTNGAITEEDAAWNLLHSDFNGTIDLTIDDVVDIPDTNHISTFSFIAEWN